jgi:post-segregation antitoxin (ccd killing protein)
MAKMTKSIRFGLTPELLGEIRNAAKLHKLSISALIRSAIERYLAELRTSRFVEQPHPRTSRLEMPVVFWTQAEQEYADGVMRIFREEDR